MESQGCQRLALQHLLDPSEPAQCISATLLIVLQISYTTAVQDVCLLRDGLTLVVAVRDSHLLRVLKLDALDVSAQHL
jgi:hypothetical protein